ncbi:MAG: hypothetical protein KAS62_04480 [Candidatus Delongbacteria bacterium]|nr:hypothetical protein [Candidatus Delongbacteria bacterium]
MVKLDLSPRMKAQIMFFSAVVLFMIGFLMFINGFNRYSISGERKESGRVEFEFHDHYLYMFTHNTISYAPVTDIRFYKSDSKDKPSNPLLVFFTTTDEFRFYAEENGISEEDLKELYKELQVFMDNDDISEFGDSFFYLRFYGILGLLLAGLIGYYIIPLFKNIPKQTEKEKQEFKAKVLKKFDEIKRIKDITVKKIMEKKPKEPEEIKSGSQLLRILIPVYDENIDFKPDNFNTPFTHSIALACTSEQKKELFEQYDNKYEYIICDKNSSTAEMVARAEKWMKDFTGYLIVQTESIPKLTSSLVIDLYQSHKNAQNDCTILVTESTEENIPAGKLIKNMANRIVQISEIPEINDTSVQVGEVSLGLFCFNTKKIYDSLNKLNRDKSFTGISLSKIVEIYFKNRSKMGTFVAKHAQKQNMQPDNTSNQNNTNVPTKNIIALVLSTNNFDVNSIKASHEALSLPSIEKIYTIVKQENAPEIKQLFENDVELVFSEGKMGDADDVLKTNDLLRDFTGDIVVISESDVNITQDMIASLISDHANHRNICTYLTSNEKIILYCVNSFQFLYAVKRVSRDPETKKYYLSEIIDILIEAKKRVQEIEI